MAYVLTDYELEKVCERSLDCGLDCMNCEAFAANHRFHNRDMQDDEDDDWEDGQGSHW